MKPRAARGREAGVAPDMRAAPLVLVALAGIVLGCGRHRAAAPPMLHTVTIRQIAYQPQTISAAPGDTVEWRNQDLVPHTVTARDGAWDSGNLAPDSSWRLVVPRADSLPYACRYHTTMHGLVRVTPVR